MDWVKVRWRYWRAPLGILKCEYTYLVWISPLWLVLKTVPSMVTYQHLFEPQVLLKQLLNTSLKGMLWLNVHSPLLHVHWSRSPWPNYEQGLLPWATPVNPRQEQQWWHVPRSAEPYCLKTYRIAVNIKEKIIQLKMTPCDLSCRRPALVTTTFIKPCLNCNLNFEKKSSHERLHP